MGYQFRNKAQVRVKQNLIDIAVQEYGTVEALFRIIKLNRPSYDFDIDTDLDPTSLIFADNQSDQEIELVKKFKLEGRTVVNEDDDLIGVEDEEPAYVPIFDTIGQVPHSSFSLFLMTSTYSGPCWKVRNSTTGLELDIGFVNGYLDVDALIDFLDGSAGTIARWYNQGTSAAHIKQTTVTEQPIVKLGTFAGHSTLYVGGFSSHTMRTADIGPLSQNTCDLYMVGYKSTSAWCCSGTVTLSAANYGSSYTAMIFSSTQVRSYIGGQNAPHNLSATGRAWCNRAYREGAGEPVKGEIMLDGGGSPTTYETANAAPEADVNYIMMGAERNPAIASPYIGDLLEMTFFNGEFLSPENAALYDAWRAEKYSL